MGLEALTGGSTGNEIDTILKDTCNTHPHDVIVVVAPFCPHNTLQQNLDPFKTKGRHIYLQYFIIVIVVVQTHQ